MKQSLGSANGKLHTATLTALPLSGRDGGARLFSADLSWAQAPDAPVRSRRSFARRAVRIVLFALLAMAAVGVVMINGPADAGPNRSAARALPDPVAEAEVEVDRAVALPDLAAPVVREPREHLAAH
ncbi:hypothetical protein J5226_21840 [Lysobacter sp. K5869]|uniref:hypothetical protein n=1 Tax=Lysobacter sp. K5869 TaxID=2820808 RepID=UPI001C05FADB|nr:hypothetical protein [Lysobacter sp. K5869]QWP76200.1 hypothetical protein J5226_21840 [Lysobacter sp. K5869]